MAWSSRFSASRRRLLALMRKESLQIARDPSSYLIAGVLPLILLFIFGVGVSLDLRRVPIGVVVETYTPETLSLLQAFHDSHYFEVHVARTADEATPQLISGRIKGVIEVRGDFSRQLGRGEAAPVQLIVDGSDPNTAGLVQFYLQGVWSNWLAQEAASKADLADRIGGQPLVTPVPRYWFNPDVSSRNFLIPGAIAVIVTMIGTMLTALVVAREWERGTLEAILSTPATPVELMLSKLIPYFGLGLLAMSLAVAAAVFLFGVPFRGSALALYIVSGVYVTTMTALGLWVSTVARNQFAASQIALVIGFLPAFELSGFIFEIASMPAPIRMLTLIFPPRYYVACLQTIFLAGDVASVLIPNALVLAGFASLFLILLFRAAPRRLE